MIDPRASYAQGDSPRGESFRATAAKLDGLLTAGRLAKIIGQGVTAADVTTALGVGEWHHVGLYATKVAFYDPELETDELELVLAARDARVSRESTQNWSNRQIRATWTEWGGTKRRPIPYPCEFVGLAARSGNWLRFSDGQRKLVSGTGFKFEFLD